MRRDRKCFVSKIHPQPGTIVPIADCILRVCGSGEATTGRAPNSDFLEAFAARAVFSQFHVLFFFGFYPGDAAIFRKASPERPESFRHGEQNRGSQMRQSRGITMQ